MNALLIPGKAALIAGIGAALCISGLGWIGSLHQAIWLIAPFGATMVILFSLPASPLAQPRNIVAGHLLTSIVGLLTVSVAGISPWSLGAAVGIAIMLMQLSHTTHPPAGANPLLIMLSGEQWPFLITPILSGTLAIVIFGYLYHRFISGHPYPQRWY